MKKLLSLVLGLILAASLGILPAAAETIRVGELVWLNNDEGARTTYMDHLFDYLSAEKSPDEEYQAPDVQVVEYENLNSMLMGLISGQVDRITTYFSVGAYLCEQNEGLELMLTSPDYAPNASPALIAALVDTYKGTDFSFLMLDSKTELRDLFNTAIQSMKDDGKLYDITQEQITAGIMGEEIVPATIDTIEGADTIKVAVTGDLPPLDYIAADGTPAGFNTAVLAEISRRIGKNIELVSVDAGGRATALASGAVDVVFWARVNTPKAELSTQLTDDEVQTIQYLRETFDSFRNAEDDIPQGTIYTEPYYHDIFVEVIPERPEEEQTEE